MTRTLVDLCLLCIVVVALTGCSGQTAEQPPRLIPMEDFFKNPKETGYDLSPDGKHVAFLKPWENRLNVHVLAIGGEEPVRITSDMERDIRGFAWANNTRIVYFQDSGGDENYHAFAADIDGGNVVELTPFEGVKVGMIDDLEDNDEEMLISMNRNNPQVFDVYRINIVTGEMSLVAENPGNILGWVTDNDGLLRAAASTDGINTSLLYRAKESDPFQTVMTTSFKNTVDPLYFTFDNKYLYVTSNMERDKQAIFKMDPETGAHMEMIFEHPEVDVSRLLRSKEREVITGAAYVTDMKHYHFFDEQRKELQDFLEARLPGYEVIVTSMSRDETKVLVRTYSDKSLGAYYYYDTVSGDFEKLVDVSPWIDENEMADMKPVQYTSRDGKTIGGDDVSNSAHRHQAVDRHNNTARSDCSEIGGDPFRPVLTQKCNHLPRLQPLIDKPARDRIDVVPQSIVCDLVTALAVPCPHSRFRAEIRRTPVDQLAQGEDSPMIAQVFFVAIHKHPPVLLSV